MPSPARFAAILVVVAAVTSVTVEADDHAAIVEPARPPPADPASHAPPPAQPAHEPTAAEVEGAPAPGFESGRADGEARDSTWRQIVRGALFVPRAVVNVALSPLRGAIWANEQYHLEQLYRQIFFNDAYTIGLYPTAKIDSLFGISIGARFVDRDVLGKREHLGLQATFGGEYREAVSGSLFTGDRLGSHLGLGLDLDWERRPHDPFFGLGNTDGIESSYRVQLARAALTANVRVIDGLHVLSTSSITSLEIGRGDNGPPIDEVYMPDVLGGFGGVEHAYAQLELRLDRRHRATAWEPRAVYATGSLAATFAGRVHRLDGGRDFWRAGLELQHFVRIASGPRVLALRFHGEGVSGSREDVPFYELPALGGGSFLRGYAYERFRDRVAALGSVEYQWDLGHYTDASLFVDTGRVFPSVHELSVDHLRVGYGIAIHFHSDQGFLGEASLASSIDGGLFASISFNRVYDANVRWR